MSHDPERAYVAAMLDHADAQLDRARADMTARVDELRTTWSSGFETQLADHQARMAEIRTDTQRYLQSIASGEAAPPQDVAAGALGDAPAASPDHGHGSRQQPDPQDEHELARTIAQMPLAEYARRRAELGVRSATDLNRLG